MKVTNKDVIDLVQKSISREFEDIRRLEIQFVYTLDSKSDEALFKELFPYLPSDRIIDELVFLLTTYKYELGQEDITKNLVVCIKYDAPIIKSMCKLDTYRSFNILLTI